MDNLNTYIDHTLLKPESKKEDIINLCQQANKYKFASVCVAPCWVEVAHDELIMNGDGDTPVASVIGFPHGNTVYQAKVLEAEHAVYNGASELDIVLNVGHLKSGFWSKVTEEISSIKNSVDAGSNKVIIKYIVEVGHLEDYELFKIADILMEHKIDFIKTCTGYGPRNVTPEDITKIKEHVCDDILIKASGGIKTKDQAIELISLGADRIGTSKSLDLINV